MLVNDDNRDYYIRTMANHYGKSIKQVESEVKNNGDILEGWAEHLANDYEDCPRAFKHFRSTYYE